MAPKNHMSVRYNDVSAIKNIQHTTRYTELAADRFKGFWRD
jgi:hypothetical protein